MKKPFKKIYVDLMLKYLLLLTATVVVAVGGYAALGIIGDNILLRYSAFILEAGEQYIDFDEQTNTLTLARTLSEGERYEVLKDSKVVYSEGAALGGETEYSQEEINGIIQSRYRFLTEKTYIPEYVPFTASNGEAYALLIKIPKNADAPEAKKGVMVPEYLRGTVVETNVAKAIRNILFIMLALLVLIVFFINRLTTQKIVKPLKTLNKGLEEINRGDLSARLAFSANEEFEKVRDSFNEMAERLERTEKENAYLTQSKKQFILDLSHDLRTPITTIKGYSEALTNGMVEEEGERRKYLDYINKKSSVMAQLIDKLFEYSKLESGVSQLNLQKLDIGDCFRNVIIQHYGDMEAKGFQADIDIPDRKIWVMCDETEMQRAVGNIISNQIKYNPDNTKTRYAVIESDTQVKLVLQDFGIGIEPDVLGRVFDVMVRGDESRHGVSGTGLGLAITKKVVEMHGGRISVESKIDQGTKFTIELPKQTA